MRRAVPFIASFVVALATSADTVSQEPQGMPENWRTLSAEDFLAAANAAGAASNSAVAKHAWERFLGERSFVDSEQWSAVVAMVDIFAKEDQVVAGIDSDAREELNRRLKARMAAEPDIITSAGLYQLGGTGNVLKESGFLPAERAALFAAWMDANDWRQLPLTDLYNLYNWVSADAVDRRHFSARWSGFLTAPFAGYYTFRQVQQYSGTDSRVKLFLDQQLVLDSSNAEQGDGRFRSKQFELQADIPVAIRVEMVHDVSRIDFSEGAPMVFLNWEVEGRDAAIIPSSAFTLPEGYASDGENGLKGEYFADTNFERLQVTRLDPTLDLVWSWPPAAPLEVENASEILDVLIADVLDPQNLFERASVGDEEFFSYHLWRIAYRMSGAERRRLSEVLAGQPQVLEAMSPRAMGRLMQAIYMLPGDEHLDLLWAWSVERPQPRCVAGQFPGWGDGYYQKLNTDFYWLMGRFFQGPYGKDASTLQEMALANEDGSCNLHIAYALAFAARFNGKGKQWVDTLTARIEDNSLSGDQLATWLFARAYTQQALPGRLQPMAGVSDLESAFMLAESQEIKFWALQEMVARLSSVGRTERAKQMISERGGDFTSSEQQEALSKWTAEADTIAASLLKKQEAEAAAQREAYLAELKRRRDRAQERGDNASVARYAAAIAAVEVEQFSSEPDTDR